ncbi:uncharacterized protein LOC143595342 [Bidens hawaiensis]|uniref:uncharacterized protein LOC143595342 n=1 Tax=Bidens hawaiensis TaxID=980011 RepID=UPI004049C4FA
MFEVSVHSNGSDNSNEHNNNNNNNNTLISSLDFCHPLFLHPTDTSNIAIVNVKLKGTENYNVWASSIELALNVKNKIGFIKGTCVRSTTDHVLQAQWDRCNLVVLSWILNTINKELYASQIFSTIASNVWNELRETYCKIDGSVVYNLHKQINSITQNGTSISDYYLKLNSLWRKYDNLTKLPPCKCEATVELNEFSNRIKLM